MWVGNVWTEIPRNMYQWRAFMVALNFLVLYQEIS
jgi:hypothetical protein